VVFFDYGVINRGVFMSDKAQLHWTAASRLVRSSLNKSESDQDQFSTHVFAYNSPLEHEHLLVVFFGFLQNYFSSLGDTLGAKEIEELWLGLWSDWKDMTKIHTRLDEFSLLETTYIAAVKGHFMTDATNQNSASTARRALVAMASTPGTTGIFPMVTIQFLQFAFEICDQGNASIFRRTMTDAVNHALR
jgi:hypothetical protein